MNIPEKPRKLCWTQSRTEFLFAQFMSSFSRLNLKNRKTFLCFLSSFRLCWRTLINPKGGVPVAQERVGDSRYAWIELTCSTTWRDISLVCTKNSVNACWFNRIAIIDLTGRSFCVFLIQINVAFCHRWKQQANSLQTSAWLAEKWNNFLRNTFLSYVLLCFVI